MRRRFGILVACFVLPGRNRMWLVRLASGPDKRDNVVFHVRREAV
jgi:hypothetical protein